MLRIHFLQHWFNFTVTVAGAARTVSSVAVRGETVILTLSSATVSGQTVTVSYAVPSTNPVQDLNGNDAATLTNRAVTNDTRSAVTEVAVTSTPRAALDTCGLGEKIEITVTFSEPVEVSAGWPHFEFFGTATPT